MPTRVLIVDDHARFRASARRLLELEGYEVVGEAGDGASGIEMAAALRPDVVLLDVNLPDTTGFDVSDRLRGTGVRVVLTSDRDASEVAPFAEGAGACGFVPKGALSGANLARALA
ncbi:MAG TPA: response regulator transcription factor [Solirubrobacteraceae bacterium]